MYGVHGVYVIVRYIQRPTDFQFSLIIAFSLTLQRACDAIRAIE